MIQNVDGKNSQQAEEDVPEMEEAKLNANLKPNVFGNQLISLDKLERNSGSFQLSSEYDSVKNLTLLSSCVRPFDQVLELDDEWNYDMLHAEIAQIVRSQYGEYYQK